MPGRACRNKETNITYEGGDGKGNWEKKNVTVRNCSCTRFRPSEECQACEAFVPHDVQKERHHCNWCRCGHSRDMH